MILLADEGVDQAIVVHLRGQGHQVTAIAELAPSLPDDEVLRMANDQFALLLTQTAISASWCSGCAAPRTAFF